MIRITLLAALCNPASAIVYKGALAMSAQDPKVTEYFIPRPVQNEEDDGPSISKMVTQEGDAGQDDGFAPSKPGDELQMRYTARNKATGKIIEAEGVDQDWNAKEDGERLLTTSFVFPSADQKPEEVHEDSWFDRIPGFADVLAKMKAGERATITVPTEVLDKQTHGKDLDEQNGLTGDAKSDVIFDVEIVSKHTKDEKIDKLEEMVKDLQDQIKGKPRMTQEQKDIEKQEHDAEIRRKSEAGEPGEPKVPFWTWVAEKEKKHIEEDENKEASLGDNPADNPMGGEVTPE